MKRVKTSNGPCILVSNCDYKKLKDVLSWPGSRIFWKQSTKVPAIVIGRNQVIMHLTTFIFGCNSRMVIRMHEKNDFRRESVRLRCSVSQVAARRPKTAGTSSHFKGVCIKQGNITAQICKNQKCIHLGTFDTEIEAAMAYNNKAIELFGEFATLNQL